MKWNWQRPDWPNFRWDSSRLAVAEQEFLLGGGKLAGAVKHLDADERNQLAVESMSTEAVTTSKMKVRFWIGPASNLLSANNWAWRRKRNGRLPPKRALQR